MEPPLRQRLSWRSEELFAPGTVSERALMARALAYLFATGATAALLSLIFVPPPPGADVLGLVGLLLAGYACAAVALVGFDRLPGWGFHAILVGGTAMVSFASYFNGVPVHDDEIFYLWIGLFAFYFFSPTVAAAHLTFVALAYAGALVWIGESRQAISSWMVTVLTILIAGVLLRVLKDRIQRLVARLADAARTDPLTGLLNRRGFREQLDADLARARVDGRPVSLLIGDLDRFKEVNDRHGHHAGDRALQRLSGLLDTQRRVGDTVARVGGEEFAVIAVGNDEHAAYALAERLRHELASTFGGDDFSLAMSFGIASHPVHGTEAEPLLRAADQALYAAKERGRNCSVIFGTGDERHAGDTSDQPGGSRRRTARDERADVLSVIEDPEALRPVFQPVVVLSTGHVAGYEALARFPRTPGRGPEAWFGLAGRCGMGPELEAAAIRAALAKPGRPEGTYLSLNASPSALATRAVQDALPRDLTGLVIELTEQDLVSEAHGIEADLSNLRMRGARIAIDDAGSAYSGLQQVMRMHPDIIKLDRSLVTGVHGRADKAALIECFVRFAHRTGAAVCAEGIETEEELAVLADLDVHYGQGYGLGRPAPEWTGVDPPMAQAMLRWSLQGQATLNAPFDVFDSSDRRMEHLSSRLSRVLSLDEFDGVTDLIAAELRAADVLFSLWNREGNYVETLSGRRLAPTGERFSLGEFPITEQVLVGQMALQVLAGDPTSDASEVALLTQEGYRSLLLVPVICRGRSLGLLEVFSRSDRPWSRTDINRARIISYQVGAVLENLLRDQAETEFPGPAAAQVLG